MQKNCPEKLSGNFFCLGSGNSDYYSSGVNRDCLKSDPNCVRQWAIRPSSDETQTMSHIVDSCRCWMAVCPEFTLQMMMRSSGWQTME